MKTYSVSEAKKKNSIISEEDFNTEYQESINNPESFWQKKAEETLDWFSNWDEVTASYLEAGEVAWFKTGKLNACFNCVDRHLEIMRIKPQSFGKAMILMIIKKFPFKSCIRTFVSSPTS